MKGRKDLHQLKNWQLLKEVSALSINLIIIITGFRLLHSNINSSFFGRNRNSETSQCDRSIFGEVRRTFMVKRCSCMTGRSWTQNCGPTWNINFHCLVFWRPVPISVWRQELEPPSVFRQMFNNLLFHTTERNMQVTVIRKMLVLSRPKLIFMDHSV